MIDSNLTIAIIWWIGMVMTIFSLMAYDSLSRQRPSWPEFHFEMLMPVCIFWPISILLLIGYPGFKYMHKRFGGKYRSSPFQELGVLYENLKVAQLNQNVFTTNMEISLLDAIDEMEKLDVRIKDMGNGTYVVGIIDLDLVVQGDSKLEALKDLASIYRDYRKKGGK